MIKDVISLTIFNLCETFGGFRDTGQDQTPGLLVFIILFRPARFQLSTTFAAMPEPRSTAWLLDVLEPYACT